MKINKRRIFPVEIIIDDNYKYTQVAFFVDRPDFLKDIKSFRNKCKITKLLPYIQGKSFLSLHKLLDPKENSKKEKDLFNETFNKTRLYRDDLINIDKLLLSNKHSKVLKMIKQDDKIDRLFLSRDCERVAEEIVQKYHRPIEFKWLVIKAIVCGEVREEDYSTCSAHINLPLLGGLHHEKILEDLKVQIYFNIHPITKKSEIMNLFNIRMKNLINKYKSLTKISFVSNPDTVGNIKRDREWYWYWNDGKNFYEIAQLTKPKYGQYSQRETIRKAIKRYLKHIKTAI